MALTFGLVAGCGGETQGTTLDPRGGSGVIYDCIDKLADEHSEARLTRGELIARFGMVGALPNDPYDAFVAGSGRRAPADSITSGVLLPLRHQVGYVSWREGERRVVAQSHSASEKYIRGVLECSGAYKAATQTEQETVWRPLNGPRVVIQRPGLLVTSQSEVLARRVTTALSRPPVPTSRAWSALQRASGPGAALLHRPESCARFRLLDMRADPEAKLTIGLVNGRRIALRDVRPPRGVVLDQLQQTGSVATMRVRFTRRYNDGRSLALGTSGRVAVLRFTLAATPSYPNSAERWSIRC